MKKVICILLFALCAFAAFSQEAEAPAQEIPSGGLFGLGTSVGFIFDDNYRSAVFDTSKYIDPYFIVDSQLGLGKYCSFNFGLNYNLMALGKGVVYYGTWLEGCATWAGEDSTMINLLLAGVPYVIGLFPAAFWAFCGIDLNAYVYYHPYYNDWLDTKVGLGFSNEPANQYDQWKASYFIQPFFNVRAQADFFNDKVLGAVFVCYSYDLRAPILSLLIQEGLNVPLHKISIGAHIGLRKM